MKFWPKSLSVKDLIKIQGLLMESMNCEIQKEMFYQRWVDTRVRTSEFVPDGLGQTDHFLSCFKNIR